jgi:hypothetical protein
MASISYAQNIKYFKPVSYKPGIICIVVGVLMLFFASFGPVLIGLVLIGIGSYLIYNQTAGRPGDAEIDRQVRAVLSELRGRAIEKLGLHEKDFELIKPIIVGGKVYTSTSQVKKGKDGSYRTSDCEGVVIFFAEQELHAYKYQISLVDQGRAREETDVYFYRDVVSVSTRSDQLQITIGAQRVPLHLELFRLTTSGGTNVECSMSATASDTEREIHAARQLIRDKKIDAH